MKKLLTLIKCCFVAAAFVFAPAAMSADYKPQKLTTGKNGCYQANKKGKGVEGKRLSGAQYCHNCLNSGGNQIRWHYRVLCEGKPTEKTFFVRSQCKRQSIPDEGEQLSIMNERATEFVEEQISFWDRNIGGCDLGNW